MSYFLVGSTTKIEAGESSYRHRFGGAPGHDIAGTDTSDLNVHCLYLLDCSDPALPSVLHDRSWLPLYYPLFNNACDFAYEVTSDDEILVHLVSDQSTPDFPYEDYPRVLPEHEVRVRPLSYEQEKTLVYYYTAEFELSSDAVSEDDKAMGKDLGYPFTQIGGIQYMTQGRPEQRCPNSKCENNDYSNMHTIFAVVWNNPIPGFRVWGEYGDYSQLIFQICPECSTIYVCNRCD